MSAQCNGVLVSVEMSGWKTSLFVPRLWCDPGPWSPGLVRRGPELRRWQQHPPSTFPRSHPLTFTFNKIGLLFILFLQSTTRYT